ncbi:MAG: hypothetical protein M5U12_36110 [Verrucomicrobia bacterium]|nr:hypothetical protein [Verrucomicrobiota bacterium]
MVPDGAGNVFIADTRNNRIRVVNAAGTIRTYAGTGDAGNTGDGGPASAARFSNPRGLALAGDGALYLVDQGNSRVRRILANGTVQAVAGSGEAGFAGDGGRRCRRSSTARRESRSTRRATCTSATPRTIGSAG